MPTMLGHDLIGAFAQALATDPQGLPQPGGLVWQSSDAALRVGSALRATQDKLPLAERAAQLDAAAALSPEIARDVAEAALARLERPVDEPRAEAVRDLCACFPTLLAQQVGRPLQRAGLERGPALFPLSEEHAPATRETFYASLLPKRRPRFRTGEAVPHRDGFAFEALIGFGGFGEVWRVRERSGRVEAMKFCVDAAAARMIEREAETLTTLGERLPRHANLVAVTAVNTWQPPYWLAFEYLAGGTLEAELASRAEPMPWQEALRTFDRILQGVSAAHAAGIVHRDLKPGNVLLTADGTPKVSDFGLGKVLLPDESGPMKISAGLDQGTFTGSGFGTLGYVAPEQQEGEPADPADDVFALGVMLFHLLLGSTAAQPRYIREKLAALKEPVPPGVVDVIVAAVDQPRGRRPADARAMREMLRPYVPGLAKTPPTQQVVTRPRAAADATEMTEPGAERGRGKAALTWFVLLLLLMISVGGLAYIWSDEIRTFFGLHPSSERSEGQEQSGSDETAAAWQLNGEAEALLKAARQVHAKDALATLHEIEAFLDEHGTHEGLRPEVRNALRAQRTRLDDAVRRQADAAAEAALPWARVNAGYDPHGTLAELDKLDKRYGERLTNAAFHAKRERLARRVAELGEPEEGVERGPFATYVDDARRRAAEEAGVPRTPPAPPLEELPEAVPAGDAVEGGDAEDGKPTAPEAETAEEEWEETNTWTAATLLLALLLGVVILLVLIILVGAVPLPLPL